MSSKDHVLSSEEALNEYFTALLDEEWEESEEIEVTSEASAQNQNAEDEDPVSGEGQHTVDSESSVSEAVALEPQVITEHSVIDVITQSDTVQSAESTNSKEQDVVSDSFADEFAQGMDPENTIEFEGGVEFAQLVPESPNFELKHKNTEEKAPETPELQQKVHSDYHTSYTELEYNEFEAPDLKDIQILLDKLEALNAVPEPDIVTIIEQNTSDISRTETAVEEIQEWDVETLETEPVSETVPAEPEIAVVETQVVEAEQTVEEETQEQLETQAGAVLGSEWESTQRDEAFQVLYFEVNGVTFAVPLDELGGIHRIGEMNHLIGRPNWYLGLQTNKDDQLDVVDTAKWVMAERLVDDSHREAYQYVVMLGESKWGLAGTQLMGTELLNTEMVRWREQAGKRPWLAGMVKEKMCALIHVEAMISMLNAGLDIKALDN